MLFYYAHKYRNAHKGIPVKPELLVEYNKVADQIKETYYNMSEKAKFIFENVLTYNNHKFDVNFGDTPEVLLEIYRTGLFRIDITKSPYSKTKWISIYRKN